ncbi:transposase [Micromonospora sp. NPDC005298]|uniref:transposase n=1 Tax=Micromonospora sp. NPDC005298 TaxID=3156873 RepID=UPI0033BA7217
MDTITLIRSAIRGLLAAAGGDLVGRLRAVLSSGDDYTTTGKPVIDWDDKTARDALVDSRARDGYALLAVLDGLTDLPESVGQAMRLLATVLGQDLESGDDGTLRIARKVAPDRVISTVDPEARHGHKTSHRGFDGYKGHIVAPDVEAVTATVVTAGNVGDVEPVAGLIADLTDPAVATDTATDTATATNTAAVYGDAAYGAGEVLQRLDSAGIDAKTKVQPPVAPTGKFTKDRFDINLQDATVTCPAGTTIPIRPVKGHARHAGKADFGTACATCPLRGQCTDSKTGRSITIGHHEAHLTAARTRQQDPAWQADYRATRPKVERKIAHLMRRRHGGRRALMRGRHRVAADFTLLAAAVNLARLATLGLTHTLHG